MATSLIRSTLTGPRLATLTQYELRLFANKLSLEWSKKGYLEEDEMPERWRLDVGLVRAELRRRGQQLRLFG
jgi:hypothetical protein